MIIISLVGSASSSAGLHDLQLHDKYLLESLIYASEILQHLRPRGAFCVEEGLESLKYWEGGSFNHPKIVVKQMFFRVS